MFCDVAIIIVKHWPVSVPIHNINTKYGFFCESLLVLSFKIYDLIDPCFHCIGNNGFFCQIFCADMLEVGDGVSRCLFYYNYIKRLVEE